jgi:hypothetical protein
MDVDKINCGTSTKDQKTRGRFWHTHERAYKHYSSILNVDDIMHKIPTLIKNGFYKDADYNQVPKKSRQVGCGYYLVTLKGKEYVAVLDQFDDQLKTILAKKDEYSMVFLVDIFENEDMLKAKYLVSQMFSQMTFELGRAPSIFEVSKESGLPEEVLEKLINTEEYERW